MSKPKRRRVEYYQTPALSRERRDTSQQNTFAGPFPKACSPQPLDVHSQKDPVVARTILAIRPVRERHELEANPAEIPDQVLHVLLIALTIDASDKLLTLEAFAAGELQKRHEPSNTR